MPLHLVLIHFPVALLVVGAAIDAYGALTGRQDVRRGAGVLLLLGALAALPAFLTGDGALAFLSRDIATRERAAVHAQWAGVGVWLLLAGGALRAVWRRRLHGAQGWASLGVAVLSALLVMGIALSGTAISHPG